MRSRIAITALLATGALMSSGGAAFGISALSTTRDASQAQYGPVSTTRTNSPTARANTLAGQPLTSSGNTVPGSTTPGDEQATAKVQPARQIATAGSDELPFTGYAAIPLLLIGLVLLVSGLVLRRGAKDSQQVT